MFRSKVLPVTIAALIFFGMTGATLAEWGEHENHKEIVAVLAAKTSLTQAITVAEQDTGGRAVKVGIEKKKGTLVYEVKTLSKDRISNVLVDPMSGKVLRTNDEGLIRKILNWEDRNDLAKLTSSSTTLAAAIAAAEQHTGGKAIEARFENEDGTMRFKVEVAKDNAVHRVILDGMNGKVVNVTTAKDDEDHKD